MERERIEIHGVLSIKIFFIESVELCWTRKGELDKGWCMNYNKRISIGILTRKSNIKRYMDLAVSIPLSKIKSSFINLWSIQHPL